MRIYFLFFLICFSIIAGALVFAQENLNEAPKYNFASVQGAKEITASPGGIAEGKIYFYNINGNRITHIKLEVVNNSQDWEVSVYPELEKTSYDVSGIETEVEENLAVEPSSAQEQAGKDEEGYEWIQISQGYVKAKPVTIEISIPEDAEIGAEYNIKVNGVASWLGQAGNIAFNQARDFDFNVKVVQETNSSGIYTETKIEKKEEIKENETEATTGNAITGNVIGSSGSGKGIYIVIITILIIIIIALLIIQYKRRMRWENYGY